MFAKITTIVLGVKDLKQATDFYVNGLKMSKMEWEGDITFIKLDNLILSLYEINNLAKDIGIKNTKGNGFSGITFAHNVSHKIKVDELYAKAIAAGATPITAPEKKEWGGYSAYFCDLDGYYWEIVFNPFF